MEFRGIRKDLIRALLQANDGGVAVQGFSAFALDPDGCDRLGGDTFLAAGEP